MFRARIVWIVTVALAVLIVPVVAKANVKPDYWLPYDSLVSRTVSQGNGGDGTHGTQPDYYAWDFAGGGWIVRATRGGTVVDLRESIDDDTGHKCNVSGAPANFVRIDHGDGYESLYFHLRENSVPVTVGQKVQRYTNLGLTGWTGNACGEQLIIRCRRRAQPATEFAPRFPRAS